VEASAPELEAAGAGVVDAAADAAVRAEGEAPEEPVDAAEAARPGAVVVVAAAAGTDDIEGGASVGDGLRAVVALGVPGMVVALVGVVVGVPVEVVVEGLCAQMAA
jgi:hypothetical protein